MSGSKVRYPGPGCLVEFMQGNSPVQAVVLEDQGGRLRLYGVNKRETKLQASRLLPWAGPDLGAGLSRQRMDEALEEHRVRRAAIADEISAMEVWELTQGEMAKASAEWLAGLVWGNPGIDQEAALGHVLLAAKTHFRFSPPDFEIFPQETVEARLAEAEANRLREAFAVTGAQFFQKLWDVYLNKRGPITRQDLPEEPLAAKLKELVFSRLADPEASEDAAVWKLLVKGLPDVPHQALTLAVAWGLVPQHHNFWLDRAGYVPGDDWAEDFSDDARLVRERETASRASLEKDTAPFVSVDPSTTRDRDDAFTVKRHADGGFTVKVALACPALVWPFGNALDRAVQRRSSSLYLPEGTHHMLPGHIGRDLFSLDAGAERISLVADISLSPEGEITGVTPGLRAVTMAANLDLESCEAALMRAPEATDTLAMLGVTREGAPDLPEQSAPFVSMLADALVLCRLLMAGRIAAGAVITERPDPEIRIKGEGPDARVSIENGPEASLAHLVVGEIMVLCNNALTAWATDKGVPLLYRTQDVALPREFAGIWTEAQDISRVVRALPPASLEETPKRHAGLGLAAYATFSSPIRRYVDLLNQGQVVGLLRDGTPRFGREGLRQALPMLSACSDAVTQVQRMRPRYWKLLFFKQQGDRRWWDAVVADENEAFATISLPWAQLLVRGKRRQFDEKLHPGMHLRVRIGKVNPLLGEIQVLEAQEA